MSFALLAAALVSQLPAEPTAPQIEEEMVVIGQKLRNWRGRIKTERGVDRCRTVRSTGDRDIDAVGCEAMAACFAQVKPRLIAAGDRRLDRSERKRLANAAAQDLGACTFPKRRELIEQLAERRWQAKQGMNDAQD